MKIVLKLSQMAVKRIVIQQTCRKDMESLKLYVVSSRVRVTLVQVLMVFKSSLTFLKVSVHFKDLDISLNGFSR